MATNTPGVLTDTADLPGLYLMAAARRVVEEMCSRREVEGLESDHVSRTRRHGETLGIVGLGRIRQAVARRAPASI